MALSGSAPLHQVATAIVNHKVAPPTPNYMVAALAADVRLRQCKLSATTKNTSKKVMSRVCCAAFAL